MLTSVSGMALRTTTPVQRIDMMLTQAERFAEVTSGEEAIARARQVIAYSELERSRATDPEVVAELESRELLAEALIARLSGEPVRASVSADEAAVPESWT